MPASQPPLMLPAGFRYQPELIDRIKEEALATALGSLHLKPFEFHDHFGNRRVVSFGLRYDYARRGVEVSDDPPEFLDDLRKKVANFAGRRVEEFVRVGVNEYRPGAGIGWHRDKPQFGDVVGVSILSQAKMRFRRRSRKGWVTCHKCSTRGRCIYWRGKRGGSGSIAFRRSRHYVTR